MKKHPRIGLVIVSALLGTHSALAREVSPGELRPFAQNFKCADPMLQWQFDHLISLKDENGRMASKSPRGRLPFITQASDVDRNAALRGQSDWLYRGVTNRQFNEPQILKVIFNDPTSVSESRWFTEDLFKSLDGDLVRMRSRFQDLPADDRCDRFERAYTDVSGKIEHLLNHVEGPMNAFSEHVQIGSTYDATPQAIQFLTPHEDLAEKYGEYVLMVRETVKRGIDVERYNYHNPGWNYSIGSIYADDIDEYMVPSHIPSWDVQMVKVRPGEGWHQGSYPPPVYYYTKLTEDKNPCNVIGIEVDRPTFDREGRPLPDNRRIPAGVIMKCPAGQSCESHFDGTLPAESQARLQRVIAAAKVGGQSLYYIPYALYQAKSPELIKQSSLATINSYYDHISDTMKGNSQLWHDVLLGNYKSDLRSAVELASKNPSLQTPAFKEEWKKSFEDFVKSGAAASSHATVSDLIRTGGLLDVEYGPEFTATTLKALDNPRDRATVMADLITAAKDNPKLEALREAAKKKFSSLSNLSPDDEIVKIQLVDTDGQADALPQTVAKGLNTDPTLAARVWSKLTGDEAAKKQVMEKALDAIRENAAAFPKVDGLALWAQLGPTIHDPNAKASLQGLCINLAVSTAPARHVPAYKIASTIAQLGLPHDRELTTIRAVWDLGKHEPDLAPRAGDEAAARQRRRRAVAAADPGDGSAPATAAPAPTNKFEFFSGVMTKMYKRLASDAATEDAADHGSRAKNLKENFVQFLQESLQPPEKLIGFSNLNQIRQIVGNDDLLLLPQSEHVKLDPGGSERTVQSDYIKTVLTESMSAYYLNFLRQTIQKEKNPARKRLALQTARTVLDGYEQYALGQLEGDLQDATVSPLIQQRFAWNPHENTAAVVEMLAGLEHDPAKRARLEKVAGAVRARFPSMEKGPASADPFWKELKDRAAP